MEKPHENAAPEAKATAVPTTAIAAPKKAEVQRVPVAINERGMDFRSFDELSRWCVMAAGSDIVPKDFQGKPANIMVAIQNGRELGLSPMQAIQNTAVINGRPTIFGDLPLALCQASPVWDHRAFKEGFEGDAETATACCSVGRIGGTTITRKFGIREAKRAKLWGKEGPWTFYPPRMLQMRARSLALRDLFSDVLRGMNIAPAATRDDVADYAAEVERTVVNEAPALPEPDPVAAIEALAAAMETPSVATAAK